MALFGNGLSKEEKQARKEAEMLARYGLDSIQDPADKESVRKIVPELAGSSMMEAGLKLSMAKAEVQLPITFQHCLMEQNWIIIRQLDRIARLLEK